jgi:hypothetical protein
MEANIWENREPSAAGWHKYLHDHEPVWKRSNESQTEGQQQGRQNGPPTGLADSGPVATEKTLTKPRGSAFAEPLNVGYCGLAVGLNGCGGWI